MFFARFRELTGTLSPLPITNIMFVHLYIQSCTLIVITCYSHSLRDASAGRNVDESEIDRRVQEAIEMEDPDT